MGELLPNSICLYKPLKAARKFSILMISVEFVDVTRTQTQCNFDFQTCFHTFSAIISFLLLQTQHDQQRLNEFCIVRIHIGLNNSLCSNTALLHIIRRNISRNYCHQYNIKPRESLLISRSPFALLPRTTIAAPVFYVE